MRAATLPHHSLTFLWLLGGLLPQPYIIQLHWRRLYQLTINGVSATISSSEGKQPPKAKRQLFEATNSTTPATTTIKPVDCIVDKPWNSCISTSDSLASGNSSPDHRQSSNLIVYRRQIREVVRKKRGVTLIKRVKAGIRSLLAGGHPVTPVPVRPRHRVRHPGRAAHASYGGEEVSHEPGRDCRRMHFF